MDRICFVLYVLTIFFRHQLSLGMLVPILLVQPFLIWLSYGYLKQQTNHLDYLQYCMDQSLQLDKKVSELIQTQGNEYTHRFADAGKTEYGNWKRPIPPVWHDLLKRSAI